MLKGQATAISETTYNGGPGGENQSTTIFCDPLRISVNGSEGISCQRRENGHVYFNPYDLVRCLLKLIFRRVCYVEKDVLRIQVYSKYNTL